MYNTEGKEMIKDANLIEVRIPEPYSDSFNKIRETLTRIGIAVVKEEVQTLYQTCHILSKQGKYYICHFKSLFILNGRKDDLTEGDIARQHLIIKLLQDWGLLTVVNPESIDDKCSISRVKVVKAADKLNWKLVPKYRLNKENGVI